MRDKRDFPRLTTEDEWEGRWTNQSKGIAIKKKKKKYFYGISSLMKLEHGDVFVCVSGYGVAVAWGWRVGSAAEVKGDCQGTSLKGQL